MFFNEQKAKRLRVKERLFCVSDAEQRSAKRYVF